MTFYAVSVPSTLAAAAAATETPPSLAVVLAEEERVFDNKDEALKCLKTMKNSRLKAFATRQEAVEFATAKRNDEQTEGGGGGGGGGGDGVVPPPPSEGCPFKSLTPQQLKQLKEAIKACDERSFKKLVESNPRYLLTPCDTPSVVHSGTRSNPLHVAAATGSVKMTSLVLDSLLDPNLMLRMYPDESNESRARRQEYLFDLYLNSHLKGSYDTPLHQAAKIGAIDVVATLVRFSSCDTKRRNRDGLTPSQIAGTRMATGDPQVAERIRQLLSDHLYIPVFRVCDKTEPAFLGDPWSPRPVNNNGGGGGSSNYDLEALSPVLISHQLPSSSLTSTPRPKAVAAANSPHLVTLQPPELPLPSSPVCLQAILGPVSPRELDAVNHEWRKPSDPEAKLLRLADPAKGLERHGRQLARQYCSSACSMIEYWEFLDTYCDLTTDAGLDRLDEHLRDMTEVHRDQSGSWSSMRLLEREFAGLRISDVDGLEGSVADDHETQSCDKEAVWKRQRTPPSADRTSSSSPPPSSSSGSADSFYTVDSKLPTSEDSVKTAEGEGGLIYMLGLTPTQTDRHVFAAIEDVFVDRAVLPYLAVWKDVVGCVPEKQRVRWPEHGKEVDAAAAAASSIQRVDKSKLSVVSKKLFQ